MPARNPTLVAVQPGHARRSRVAAGALTAVDVLLTQLDQAYDSKSWHGTNLRGSIRGLTAEHAAWRPQPARHSIQEIAVHAAYWKYAARRRLTGEKRGSFPLKGSNWFARQTVDSASWQADVELLAACHVALRAVVASLSPPALQRSVGGSTNALSLVSGIIAHDLYHAGQIQLIKRMREGGGP
jgi:uncharacterized damage-inducible protein DinB